MAEAIETIWSSDAAATERFFTYAGYRVRNMREPLEEAGLDFIDHIMETFNTEGASVGEYWPEVSTGPPPPGRGNWRAAKEAHPSPEATFLLRYNDQLIDEATDPLTTLNLSIGENEMVYELDEPFYAHIHMEGAEWVTKNGTPAVIPPRPFIVVTEEFSEHVALIFRDWLDDLHDANRRRAFLDRSLNPL